MAVFHFEMSPLKADAYENMKLMSVTLAVFHFEMSGLQVPSGIKLLMSVMLDVSHPEIGPNVVSAASRVDSSHHSATAALRAA